MEGIVEYTQYKHIYVRKLKNKEIKKLDIILNQNISFSIIGFIIYYKYYIFVILSILIIFIILFSINRKKSN